MHGNAGAFVALLEPDKNRRAVAVGAPWRRLCNSVTDEEPWYQRPNVAIARGSLEKIKTLACGATQVYISDKDGVRRPCL